MDLKRYLSSPFLQHPWIAGAVLLALQAPTVHAACLSVSDDPQISEKLGIGWTEPAGKWGLGTAWVGGAGLSTAAGFVQYLGVLPATAVSSALPQICASQIEFKDTWRKPVSWKSRRFLR